MYGTEQNLIGMIEDPLCTIPMMAVNIQNENLFSLISKFLNCNGNIIKKAEAICPFWFGMVSWRTNHRKITPFCSHYCQTHG